MEQVSQQLKTETQEKHADHLVLVVSKNTIDSVYPPLILAETAAASGMSVDIYFTFWGLSLLKKNQNSTKLASVGNPSLPMPNILGVLPGMTGLATKMMKKKISKFWPSIPEMMKEAKELGVRFHACSPTMGLMGMTEKDLSPLADDICGASAFLDWATSKDTVTIFT